MTYAAATYGFHASRMLAWVVMAAVIGCSEDAESPTSPQMPEGPALATAATYTFRDLGTLGTLPGARSEAMDVNDYGAVVGWSTTNTAGQTHAVRWHNGVKTDLGTLGGTLSEAHGINRDGIIVGWSTTSAGAIRAVRWVNGSIRNLGTLGGAESRATDINALGWIVGWSDTKVPGQRRAFIWKNGVMTALGTLGGSGSVANAISNGGVVVGSSSTTNGETHAFWWKDGVMHDMGRLGGQRSVALSVNTARQIVGWAGPRSDAVGEELDDQMAFSWYRGVHTNFLGGGRQSKATDINAVGVIVGRDEHDGGEILPRGDAWVLEQGVLSRLPEPEPVPNGWSDYGTVPTRSGANAINGGTHIVGYAQTAENRHRAALWRRG